MRLRSARLRIGFVSMRLIGLVMARIMPMVFLRHVVIGNSKKPIHRGMIAKEAAIPHHAAEHRAKRENTQGYQHDFGAFMRVLMRMVITARLTVKG